MIFPWQLSDAERAAEAAAELHRFFLTHVAPQGPEAVDRFLRGLCYKLQSGGQSGGQGDGRTAQTLTGLGGR